MQSAPSEYCCCCCCLLCRCQCRRRGSCRCNCRCRFRCRCQLSRTRNHQLWRTRRDASRFKGGTENSETNVKYRRSAGTVQWRVVSRYIRTTYGRNFLPCDSDDDSVAHGPSMVIILSYPIRQDFAEVSIATSATVRQQPRGSLLYRYRMTQQARSRERVRGGGRI